jgi:hypothetical protein
MTAYIWTMVVLYGLGVLIHAHYLGSGTTNKPTTPGVRAVVLVIDAAMCIWGLRVLGAL